MSQPKSKTPAGKTDGAADAAAEQAASTTADAADAEVADTTQATQTTPEATPETTAPPADQPDEDPLQQALAEAAAHKDNALRLAAELENTRRRAQKQVEDAHKFALTGFALAISEVHDLLQKALATTPAAQQSEDAAKLREGVSLTHRKLTQALEAHHVHPILPDIGAAFDPNLHQAIGRAPATPDAPPDTVAAVISGGVMLHGRTLRPANVMVAAEPEADPAPQTSDNAPHNQSDEQPPAAPTGK